MILDGRILADQKVDPVLGHDAGTVGIDVRSMRGTGWHAVDVHADAYGLTVHGRTHHQMQVARVEAIAHAALPTFDVPLTA